MCPALFNFVNLYKLYDLYLCKHTKFVQTQRNYLKTLDIVQTLCYNINREKENNPKPERKSDYYENTRGLLYEPKQEGQRGV